MKNNDKKLLFHRVFLNTANETRYSYRNASIGSRRDAFIAGYNPETKATMKVVMTAANIA